MWPFQVKCMYDLLSTQAIPSGIRDWLWKKNSDKKMSNWIPSSEVLMMIKLVLKGFSSN